MKYRMAAFLCVMLAAGCRLPRTNNLPPATELMHPGPGVDGPGPGVMMMGGPMMPPVSQSSQLAFVGPDGMNVGWDVSAAGAFDSEPLICPGRQNFGQGALYRLRLSNIPGRPGIELFPTVEVGPAMPRTEAYLAHNAIPIQFTEEDFDQVLSGNFVTKVIYLPDEEFQDLAVAGVETLVSTRLDPGVNPVVEADRRGSILSIIRVGNKDLHIPEPEMMGGGAAGIEACGYDQGMPGYVSGYTAPQYGMPMSGAPIGLVGPPHIPLGGPAGLQQHVMRNHTHYRVPGPTDHLRIDVRQSPGFSYPRPVRHVRVHERTSTPPAVFGQPGSDGYQCVQ